MIIPHTLRLAVPTRCYPASCVRPSPGLGSIASALDDQQVVHKQQNFRTACAKAITPIIHVAQLWNKLFEVRSTIRRPLFCSQATSLHPGSKRWKVSESSISIGLHLDCISSMRFLRHSLLKTSSLKSYRLVHKRHYRSIGNSITSDLDLRTRSLPHAWSDCNQDLMLLVTFVWWAKALSTSWEWEKAAKRSAF